MPLSWLADEMWAYSKKSKASFDEAENLIFDDKPQQDKRESKVDE